jgi:hypothetical protein
MADRCSVTELIVEQCAHCRRIPDPPKRLLGRMFTSAFAGRCIDCEEPFEAGTRLRYDPAAPGYVASCCAGDSDA